MRRLSTRGLHDVYDTYKQEQRLDPEFREPLAHMVFVALMADWAPPGLGREKVARCPVPTCRRTLMSSPEGQELVRFHLHDGGVVPPRVEERGRIAKCAGCGAMLVVHARGVKLLTPPPSAPPPPAPAANPVPEPLTQRRVRGMAVPRDWRQEDIEALERELGMDDEGPGFSGPQPSGRDR